MSEIKTWQERCLKRGIGSCETRDEELIELRAALKERDADIDRLTTRFHDSDCAIHCAPAYPASEVGCDCRLAELDKWESSYNSICEERDAIAKDNDKAHALLRQSLDALEAALSDDQPYIQQSKDAVTAIKEFL